MTHVLLRSALVVVCLHLRYTSMFTCQLEREKEETEREGTYGAGSQHRFLWVFFKQTEFAYNVSNKAPQQVYVTRNQSFLSY